MAEVKADRSLVRVVKVKALKPLVNLKTGVAMEGYEIACVEGWNVMVPKGKFKVDQLVVYAENDTVADDINKGKRVMPKVVHGICCDGILDDELPDKECGFGEGDDVTDIFFAKKYVEEEEKHLYEMKEGDETFPPFVQKTDELRINQVSDKLLTYIGKLFVFLMKYDGCSATFMLSGKDLVFDVCSRNLVVTRQKKVADKRFLEMAKKLDIEAKLRLHYSTPVAIQGEICGPGINGNRMKLKECGFFVFKIQDLTTQRFLDWDRVLVICEQMGLQTVETVEGMARVVMTPELADKDVLQGIADKLEYSPGIPAEGFVPQTIGEKRRFSAKVLSRVYKQ